MFRGVVIWTMSPKCIGYFPVTHLPPSNPSGTNPSTTGGTACKNIQNASSHTGRSLTLNQKYICDNVHRHEGVLDKTHPAAHSNLKTPSSASEDTAKQEQADSQCFLIEFRFFNQRCKSALMLQHSGHQRQNQKKCGAVRYKVNS